MTGEELLKTAKDVFGNCNIALTLQTSREHIPEWDSLAHLQLIAEIEERFQKKIKIKDIERIKGLEDLLSMVK